MDNILKLKNINKIYGTDIKTHVLKDLNLDIKKNSFNAIIGASGSGKSTLLNIMGTLDHPTDGTVLIDEIDTSTLNKNKLAELRNEKIGFIFQFHHLLPEFSVIENILMPYQIHKGSPSKEILERANKLIDQVGLTEVKHNKATNISGGQQQRTAIARALINNPKLVFADEPTGNLDSETSNQVYSLLREINQEIETTFVIITHDLNIAKKADRIIELKDGMVVKEK